MFVITSQPSTQRNNQRVVSNGSNVELVVDANKSVKKPVREPVVKRVVGPDELRRLERLERELAAQLRFSRESPSSARNVPFVTETPSSVVDDVLGFLVLVGVIAACVTAPFWLA